MKVTVVCVGKLKEKYWRDAIAEYSKRLSRYMKLEIIELADEKAPENMSDAQAAEVTEDVCLREIWEELSAVEYRHARQLLSLLEQMVLA